MENRADIESKDSGAIWLGSVPENWEIDQIGSLYTLRNTKVSDVDYPPLSVTMQGIVPQLENAAKTDAHDDRKLVCVGDFAINSRSDRRGSCGISSLDGSVSLINIVLTPRNKMHPGYYNWLFHTVQFADEFYKWGHGIVNDLWTTRWQEMKKIVVPYPPLEEQAAISDYLDVIIEKVNASINELKKSVEEYSEWRASVVYEILTKGINPNEVMRDSGYSYIGKVPQTAQIMKLKNIVEISDGTHDTPAYVDKGENTYPLVTSRCIVNGHIDLSIANHISKEDYDAIVQRSYVSKYDVIMPMIGTVGNPAVVETEEKFALKNVGIFRTNGSEILGKFVAYMLDSLVVKTQFELKQRGGVQNFVSQSLLNNLAIPVLANMEEIVCALDDKCGKIDMLIKEKESLIESLEEYKKSLIFEAVTGKRKVV